MSDSTWFKLMEPKMRAIQKEARDYIHRMHTAERPSDFDEQKLRFAGATLYADVKSLQSESVRSEAHVHRCMSCGERWYCPHQPTDCKAGEDVFPSLTLRGPDGPAVFHHACRKKP